MLALLALFTLPIAHAANTATFVSQSVPTQMVAGQAYSVSVSMSSGASSWLNTSTYQLKPVNPAGNTTWGRDAVPLSVAVVQDVGTFNFTVTAPLTAGVYNFQWKMYEGATPFGNASTNVAVTVAGASTTTPPADPTTPTSPTPPAAPRDRRCQCTGAHGDTAAASSR